MDKNNFFDIEKAVQTIDPNVSKIREVVALTKEITVTDFEDKEQLKVAKDNRIILRDIRIKISKKMKEFRDDAIKFQKDVIVKEKELIGEISPEEDRLKALEDKGKEVIERKRRMAVLPQRKEQLSTIGDKIKVGHELWFNEGIEEALLKMDDKDFDNYFTSRMSAKNEADRKELDDKKRELEAKEKQLEREKEIGDAKREAEENAKNEAKKQAEKEKEEKIKNRVNSITTLGLEFNVDTQSYILNNFNISVSEIKTDTDEEFAVKVERIRVAINKEKEEKEREEEAKREAEENAREEERLAKEKEYIDWLASLGYKENLKDDFKIIKEGNEVKVYKLLGTYNIK